MERREKRGDIRRSLHTVRDAIPLEEVFEWLLTAGVTTSSGLAKMRHTIQIGCSRINIDRFDLNEIRVVAGGRLCGFAGGNVSYPNTRKVEEIGIQKRESKSITETSS